MAYNCEQELRKKDKRIAELEVENKRLNGLSAVQCWNDNQRLEAEIKMYEDWFAENAGVLASHRIGGYYFTDDGEPYAVLTSKAPEDK